MSQFFAHGGDNLPIVIGTKYRRTGNKGVSTGLGNFPDIFGGDAAIYLQTNRKATVINQLPSLAQFLQGVRNKLLPAKAGFTDISRIISSLSIT